MSRVSVSFVSCTHIVFMALNVMVLPSLISMTLIQLPISLELLSDKVEFRVPAYIIIAIVCDYKVLII